jgi:integrase
MARKRSREGSIYPVTETINGKTYSYWIASRELKGANGKRKRQVVRLKTEREARAKLAEFLRQPATTAGPRMTLGEYLEQWLSDARDLKPSTLKRYRAHYRSDIAPRLGRVRLDKLTADDVQTMIHDLEKTHKPLGVRNARAFLRKALNDAIAKRYLTYNAAEPVKLPRDKRYVARVLTVDEIGRLFAAINGDRLGSLFSLTLRLGLRKGEALGLTWDRVNFAKGTVTIDRQFQEGELVETKTSTARVYNLGESIAMLKDHQAKQRKEAVAAGWRNDEGFVFTTTNGTPYGQRNVVRDFKTYLAKAGLPATIRFQDLRGTAATLFVDRGFDASTAQKLLGHADIRTTLKYYIQARDGRQREALEDLARLIPA